MNLTTHQLHTLRHMLGINDPRKGRPEPYRNYFCANPEEPEMVALADAGLIVRYAVCDEYWWYTATEAGIAAAIESYKTIRWSRPRRVYHRFLQARDAIPDLTFRDFLVDRAFARARREA